jgi:Transposase, Mutator family
MYLAGVWVRRVEDITEALWGTRVSPSTVSNLNSTAPRDQRFSFFPRPARGAGGGRRGARGASVTCCLGQIHLAPFSSRPKCPLPSDTEPKSSFHRFLFAFYFRSMQTDLRRERHGK